MKKLPGAARAHIQPHIDALALEPRPHGVVKLEDKTNLWRIRAGAYPSIPHFSLIDASGRRRGAFEAFQRFLAAVAPKKKGESASLSRTGELPEGMHDLAVARPGGFAYFVWQETPVERFDEIVPPKSATVTLRVSTGRKLRVLEILDPITERPEEGARAESHEDGTLTLTLGVADYPVICRLAM